MLTTTKIVPRPGSELACDSDLRTVDRPPAGTSAIHTSASFVGSRREAPWIAVRPRGSGFTLRDRDTIWH
jgi:hypothetical protein